MLRKHFHFLESVTKPPEDGTIYVPSFLFFIFFNFSNKYQTHVCKYMI